MPGHRGEDDNLLGFHHHDDGRCPAADGGRGVGRPEPEISVGAESVVSIKSRESIVVNEPQNSRGYLNTENPGAIVLSTSTVVLSTTTWTIQLLGKGSNHGI